MKRIAFTLIMFCAFTIKAQVNLVPNPSFEDTAGLIYPNAPLFMDNVLNWYLPNNTSTEYYNEDYGTAPYILSCCYHYARTGKAFVGLIASPTTANMNYREYIQVRLNQPLVAGKQYAVGYYYSIVQGASPSIANSLGFRFSYDTLSYPSWFSTPPINYDEYFGVDSLSYMDTNLALVSAISVGGDTTAWYSLQTTYTAVGGEEYLTIGNLYGAANTNHIYISTPPNPINQITSYYIIDDVYVLDIEQLQDTDLVYIDTFNVGAPITYNCIENSCTDPANATGIYSTLADCQFVCGVNGVKEEQSTKQIISVIDVLGNESKPKPNVPLFYRYNDGTVEKRIIIE